jgi:hypothetical protein
MGSRQVLPETLVLEMRVWDSNIVVSSTLCCLGLP